MISQLCLVAMMAVALVGALCDVRSLTIPNSIPALIVGLFIPYASAANLGAGDVLAAVAIALAILTVGFGLFAAGLAGGGDVKLLAAVGLWAGSADIAVLLLVTAFAGAALALCLVVAPVNRAVRALRVGTGAAAAPSNAMPYGVAITAGAVAVVLSRLA